jgi:toxin ParE1/3/4
MKIDWSKKANRDLDQIDAFLMGRNPKAADAEGEAIFEVIALLERFPDLGRLGRCFNTREILAGKTPYLIAYRVKKDALQILRIMHPKQEWPEEM